MMDTSNTVDVVSVDTAYWMTNLGGTSGSLTAHAFAIDLETTDSQSMLFGECSFLARPDHHTL